MARDGGYTYDVGRLLTELERHYRVAEAAPDATPAVAPESPEGDRRTGWEVPPVDRAGDPPWWPANPAPDFSLVPAPGFACARLAAANVEVVAVHVFGLSGDGLEDAIRSVDRLQRKTRSFIPLFVTDAAEHLAFERRGYGYEYLPPARCRVADGALDWEKVRARRKLIDLKWNVTRSMDFSAPADRQPAKPSRRAARATGRAATGAGGAVGADLEADAAVIRASGLFDEAWYLERYPEVAETHADPVIHFLEVGAAKGYDPHPLFRTRYYARQLADREAASGGSGDFNGDDGSGDDD